MLSMSNTNTILFFDIIGVLGGVLNVICLIPQIMRMYKTMEAKGLHKRYFLISLCGFILDFTYLISIGAWAAWIPMILTVALFYFCNY